MKIKTSELIGPALDWAVAKCEGEDYSPTATTNGIGMELPATNYSTDWMRGGPIIEQEGIELRPSRFGATGWTAWTLDRATKTQPRNVGKSASSPLIAAMRCYVASKLGDVIDIPDALCIISTPPNSNTL